MSDESYRSAVVFLASVIALTLMMIVFGLDLIIKSHSEDTVNIREIGLQIHLMRDGIDNALESREDKCEAK